MMNLALKERAEAAVRNQPVLAASRNTSSCFQSLLPSHDASPPAILDVLVLALAR